MEQSHQPHQPQASSGARPPGAGLGDLARPKVGPLGPRTADFVRQTLALYPNQLNNRLCSVEVVVNHGKLEVLAPALPVCKLPDGHATAKAFLESTECEALRRQLPLAVADLLHDTGQEKYLVDNAQALTRDWRIVVDVDSYRRSGTEVGFHKDSMGRTLFTVLAYIVEGHGSETFLGPEYILNPPAIAGHLDFIAASMPEVFVSDLKQQVDALPAAKRIDYATIPSAGFIGMVDELLHHSTPFIGSRNIGYYWADVEDDGVFQRALEAHCGAQAREQFELAAHPRTRGGALPPEFGGDQARFEGAVSRFEAAARRLARLPDLFQESDLRKAAAQEALVDEILAHAHLSSEQYTEVKLRHSATNDHAQGKAVTAPLKVLQRQLSQDRLDKKPIPPLPDVRPFVRLWVMAVPRT